jgi:RP/EB family microtubule-associated protein
MKRYFDINYNGEPYDAAGRRKGQDLFYIGSGNKPVRGNAAAAATKKKTYKPTVGVAPKKFTKPVGASTGAGAAGGTGSVVQKKKITELESEVAELKLTSDTLEKERDFYFGKLRDIEVLLQAYQDQEIPVVDMVLKILYATEDEKVEVDENGNLNITNVNAAEGGDEEIPAEDPNQEVMEENGVEPEGEYIEAE